MTGTCNHSLLVEIAEFGRSVMFSPISLHAIYSIQSFGEKHEREDTTTHEARKGSISHVKCFSFATVGDVRHARNASRIAQIGACVGPTQHLKQI